MTQNNILNLIEENKLSHSVLILGGNADTWQETCSQIKEKMQVHSIDALSIDEAPKVEDLREKLSRAHYFPKNSNQSILFLLDVSAWSIGAQNTLLKLVEEPPKFLKIFMFSQKLSGILPTILSRVQVIKLSLASLANDDMVGLSELKKLSLSKALEQIKNSLESQSASDIMNNWLTEANFVEADYISRQLQLIGTQPVNQRLAVEAIFFKIKFMNRG